jgi:hypothetical protein
MPCWELRFVLSVVFYVVNENPQNRIRSKSCKSKRKHQKSEDFRCCSGAAGQIRTADLILTNHRRAFQPLLYKALRRFLSKKDEVAACLFHCFRPLISPCGSRCGSNNFQDANEGRTSDSGKPSRCALSRS